MKNNKKYIRIGTTRPSYAIAAEYSRRLKKLFERMTKDVLSAVLNEYKINKNKIIAIDASPSSALSEIISRKFKFWQKVFESKAGIFAESFINSIDKHNKSQIKQSLDQFAEKITVKFSDETKQTINANKAMIQEQINLITSIPEQFQKETSSIIFEAISRGRDFSYLEQNLQHVAGITARNARLIAHNQINYATSVINRARQLDLGLTKNQWQHSAASRQPRMSHLEAEGKIFDIKEGCLIDGKKILPGQLPGCNCYSTVVLEVI